MAEGARSLPSSERERVLSLLQRFGWNAVSFQVLELGFSYFFDGDDACVAYADAGPAWVAAGPPICSEERLREVTARFVEAARAAGKRVCFFGTEQRFADGTGMPHVAVGEQPVWDPMAWEATLAGSKSLREQLRRARAKGVTVRAVSAEELAEGTRLRAQVEDVVAAWLASRRMAPMTFLVGVELFGFARERRYFAAELDGRLLALLAAVPVYARGGWLVEDLLRGGGVPNGTAELLIDAAMRAFAAEGSRYVTLGLAPLAGEVSGLLKTAREAGAVLYDFDGVRAFKARLRPGRWDPIFLASPGGSTVRAMRDVLRAFAGGGFFRFGLQTVLRGPPILVRVLAALLIPWMIALLLVDPARWFPDQTVQHFWVAFDLALCVSLFALARRWRAWLAFTLATAITFDAAVTLGEVLTFNLPRLRGPTDVLVVAAGVAAPLLASAVLWGSLRARLRA